MPVDVAGVSRPGIFESIELPDGESVTPVRGTARSVTFRTSTGNEYRGPNVRSPHAQQYAAMEQGAIPMPSLDDMWSTPRKAKHRGR